MTPEEILGRHELAHVFTEYYSRDTVLKAMKDYADQQVNVVKTDWSGEISGEVSWDDQMHRLAAAHIVTIDKEYQEHAYEDFCEGFKKATEIIEGLKRCSVCGDTGATSCTPQANCLNIPKQ